MSCYLKELFHRYKGQPIEIIAKCGMKYCGIVIEAEDDYVLLIDGKGRTIYIEADKIEAVVEPRMKLHRLCGDNDCCCKEKEEEEECCL